MRLPANNTTRFVTHLYICDVVVHSLYMWPINVLANAFRMIQLTKVIILVNLKTIILHFSFIVFPNCIKELCVSVILIIMAQ